MKKIVLIHVSILSFLLGHAQEKQMKQTDSVMPKENIQVNKEYDENGNLTRYDSIYSYSYSSSDKMNDSLKTVFERYFKNNHVMPDNFFDDFFKKDSISGRYNMEELFSQSFGQQQGEIKNIMKQVDSLQRLFFEDKGKAMPSVAPKTSN
ncbi:hypothetical protein [Gaetbulibacter aestuarii]|uniref:Uncharacterized protein n=1 Tax=Gaetbulibacter aestuarii TaxID=1502358 RepID=A0ABW7N0A5_9FLAO